MTNFRPTTLSPEALKAWDEAEANIEASMQRIRELTAPLRHPTPQPVPEGRSSDGGYEAGTGWAGHPMRTQPPADGEVAQLLRATRRPQPPSLKEQALADLDTIQTHDRGGYQIADLSNIRRALEQLPNAL